MHRLLLGGEVDTIGMNEVRGLLVLEKGVEMEPANLFEVYDEERRLTLLTDDAEEYRSFAKKNGERRGIVSMPLPKRPFSVEDRGGYFYLGNGVVDESDECLLGMKFSDRKVLLISDSVRMKTAVDDSSYFLSVTTAAVIILEPGQTVRFSERGTEKAFQWTGKCLMRLS